MAKEKPPVFGMIERGGQVVIHLLDNVKQKTIEPLIKDTIDPGTLVYTDEYSIYARLKKWGYEHKHVNHGRGEFARDEDGDGFCEVHVNTMAGFWSLLRSWLRPHRGISPKNAGRPRRSRRGWIGVGRAGLDAQAANQTRVIPEFSMG